MYERFGILEPKRPGQLEGLDYQAQPGGQFEITRCRPVRFSRTYRRRYRTDPHRYRPDKSFRSQMQRMVGRWTTFRTDQGRYASKLIAKYEDVHRRVHQEMIQENIPEGALIEFCLAFAYRGRPGHRRVVEVFAAGWGPLQTD